MKVVKQISIYLENRPGTLAEIANTLSDRKINVEAFMVSEAVDYAVVRMVVSDPDTAIHVLGDRGLLVIENFIIALSLKNRPGQLVKISERLGKAKVNIHYAYGSAGTSGGNGFLFVRVSHLEKAQQVLKGL